ncbi:ficolin-1-like [Pomacea canaliculata]|uniref:ficolin-1-like n=1 Tax=Pomacea canaliculata TaxID=400727 RepID=UPI000D7357A7|nr:ficolin-1-like [Pomacea canaliculata]
MIYTHIVYTYSWCKSCVCSLYCSSSHNPPSSPNGADCVAAAIFLCVDVLLMYYQQQHSTSTNHSHIRHTVCRHQVFQRRRDGSVDFYRSWTQYEAGFGDVTGEFWLADDTLWDLSGASFSTYDRDNDNYPVNCAALYHGAWWYNECSNSNLNGRYIADGADVTDGINWYYAYYDRSFTFSEMKVKPL